MPSESDDHDADRAPSDIVREGIGEIDSGTQIGDKVVLSRRHLVMVAAGTLSLGALGTFGVEEASAQAAGSVGTSSDPVDVEGYNVTASNSLTDASGTSHSGELAEASDVTSTSTASGYEITIDGDTYEFNE